MSCFSIRMDGVKDMIRGHVGLLYSIGLYVCKGIFKQVSR